MSNQGLLQASIRGVTSTTHPLNGDWLALFALAGITTGTWDERCLQWINGELSSSHTNLAAAQQAYAVAQGFDRWSDMIGLAPTVEQDTGNQTSSGVTSDTATFAIDTVTGRGVVVLFALKGGRRVSTLTDNKSNTYTLVGTATDVSDAVVEMWYAQPITGGASHTLTVTFDAAAYCVWGAIEVSRVKGGGGFLDAPSVRTVTRGGSGSSASVTVTSGTLRANNELVVAMLSLAGGGANAGIDTPTNYTAVTQFNDYTSVHAGHGAYRTATSTAAQSATWTNDTTTAPYAAIIAAFRAVGAASAAVSAPTNSVAPAISGSTIEAQTLTCSTGTWANSPDSYTYQWEDDGVAISGATASTYLLTASEVGATITCTVTATNEGGSASATAAGVGPVTSSSYTNLLDLVSATSTGGYSVVRKLKNAYAGSAFRVRRSSDNTEQDIGFAADEGIDQAALLTFCGAGNGFVVTLYNQDGNASRDFTMATAANQPKIVDAGAVITINSEPAMLFDGSNDHLDGPSMAGLIPVNAFTVLVSCRPTAGGTAAAGSSFNNPSVVGNMGVGYYGININSSVPEVQFYSYSGAQDSTEITTAALPYTAVLVDKRASNTHTVYVNGGTGASEARNQRAGDTDVAIGRGYAGTTPFYTGYVQEVVFFTGGLSTADINTLGTDMADIAGPTWTSI